MEWRGPPYSTETLFASQNCTNCKRRKRKCNKTKPSCDLCRKLLLKCVYDARIPRSRSGSSVDERSYATASGTRRSPTNLLEAPLNTHETEGLSKWQSSAHFLASASKLYQNQASGSSITFHRSTMNQVLQILIDHGGSLPTLFSEYSRTVDVWMPVTCSKAALYTRLEDEPSAELALVVLSMFLVVQLPNHKTAHHAPMQTPLYFAAKTLLHTLLGAGVSSVEVVQAAVLVSLYEAGHGMLDQAQLSLAACSRLGMKLVARRLRMDVLEVEDTDETRLWKTIVMLDRYLNLSSPPDEVHLATGSPSTQLGALFLPVDDKLSVNRGVLPPSPDSTTGLSDRTLSFARSVDLLGHVLEYTQSLHRGRSLDLDKFKALDTPLQSLLAELLQQATQYWEDSCETIGLCLSALLTLHKARFDISDMQPDRDSQTTQMQLALMAMRSVINMVIEIAVNFNQRIAYIDLPALPLPSTYAVYQASMLHIKFSYERFGTQEWNAEMRSLENALDKFGNRWLVGKQYLQDIEDATHEETQFRAFKQKMDL